MGMKVIELTGHSGSNAVEVLASNAIVAAKINIQNRTKGPIYLWIDPTAPTFEHAGLLIKSGEIFSLERGTNTKVYIEGNGTVILQY